jgi:hypothetical protein
MFKHDAEYFRQRRRARGISERDPFSAPKFVKQGLDLQRLEQLDWPRNLFGEYATIAELMAEAAQPSGQFGDNPGGVCRCGCRRGHKHNVSQTIPSPHGRGFNVVYFRSNACKSKWNGERFGRQAGGL